MTMPPPGHSWLDTVQVQRYDRLYDARPSAVMTLGQALDSIVDGTYAPLITQARHIFATKGEAAYTSFKRRLPQYTFAGTFSPTRAKGNLQQHNGIGHGDIDHLGDDAAVSAAKLQLQQDPTLVYIFRSPRGDGLKLGVRIEPVATDAAYQHAWQTVAQAHQQQYGVTWDPSGRDVSRLCFASADTSCYINADAQEFPIPPMVVPAPPAAPRVRFHAPYSRSYGETAAERALAWAQRCILASQPGQQHSARCRASYTLGGYVGAGLLAYEEAYAALETVVSQTAQDIPRAMRTITDGLKSGAARPLTPDKTRPIPPMTTVNAKEVPPWHG